MFLPFATFHEYFVVRHFSAVIGLLCHVLSFNRESLVTIPRDIPCQTFAARLLYVMERVKAAKSVEISMMASYTV